MSWSIGTVYTKPWFWKKGNRVATISDVLTIKIGGDPIKDKKRPNNRIKSTKYSLITFLPQNLLEQFRRIANFYFLVITVIAILIDSPVTPLTSLIPLVFVIAVTGAKQGYEDFLRYRADNMVNYSFVTVIRNGIEENIKCQEILQGDLVKSLRDCDVPCDIVLLKSSDSTGKCHITTANLDGETNLKTLTVPKGLPNVPVDRLQTLGVIECEQPCTDLYTYNGRLELSPIYRSGRQSITINVPTEVTQAIPLMTENLLLRGSRIKNTDWAIGCAVYTGQNTKLSLNSRLTRNKMSSSEKFINKFLVFFLVLLITIVTISYFMKRFFDSDRKEHDIYLGEAKSDSVVADFLQDYMSFLILFNYLIPISLYVTIEMHKFLGSFFMEWDIDLYDAETNQTFIVNTSDLNEELGQIQILFSDKTGTLTKNEMILQQCSINGKKYTFSGTGIQKENRPNVMKIWEFQEDVFEFFQTLATCHTVQVAGTEDGEVITQANSVNDLIADSNKEEIQRVTSFTNIAEESEITASPDSDHDETDFIGIGGGTKQKDTNVVTNGFHIGDISPLLFHKSNEFGVNIVANPSTLDASSAATMASNGLNNNNINNNNINTNKLSPLDNKLFAFENKMKLQRPLSMHDYPNSLGLKLSPLNIRKAHLARPLSIEFKRTLSSIDTERQDYLTHRRTQSYGASTGRSNSHSGTGHKSPKYLGFRQSGSVTNLREYYAAEAFIESSLIERKESIRRKKEVDDVIENLDYQASSPDEKALVEGCGKIGFLFVGEEDDTIMIKLLMNNNRAYTRQALGSSTLKFERLSVLEFTSDRKRMSTVVRDHRGDIWLLTKGAESHVLPLCQKSSSELLAATQAHINDYAKVGFRTLAIARKRLTEEEFEQFQSDITVASNSLTNRKELIEEVQSKLETNLEVLGATAVEDALQDNVKDTIEALRNAGIKVWVLTGDKVETALNIALSCGHIDENSSRYFITECHEDEQLKEHLNVFQRELDRNPTTLFSLLIDGMSLTLALKNHANQFRDLAIRCRAVLCCRLSPLQKCEVVHLIRTAAGKPITAAIGDGANDVSMIQEAHVGLGIVGKEGRQAARCADYAFANFSMLKKVVLVHGHYFTQRLALLVLYFFYKNLVFMLIQLYFQINSMFSSQSVYDSVFLTLYNVLFTSFPVLVISLTEKVYPEDKLMKQPSLYKENTGNKRLTWKYFVGWMLLACYHSIVIYMSGYIMWRDNSAIFTTPQTANFYCFGTFMIHNVVVLVNLKLWLEAKYQSYWFIGFILGSVAVFIVTCVIYNLFVSHTATNYRDDVPTYFYVHLNFLFFNFDGDMLYVYNHLLGSPTFWLLFLMIIIAALTPDFFLKSSKSLGLKTRRLFPGNISMFTATKIHPTSSQSTYL